MKLEQRKKNVEHIYFVDSSIVSVVANGTREVEVGIIGREGMTGVSVVMGANHPSIYETYVQVAGSGRRITADELRKAMQSSASLTRTALLYAHSFLEQVTQTALANARSTLEKLRY